MSNFRNLANATLELQPGLTLIQGENGQGKSNLLEAVYMLAVAKSPRASFDRDVVEWSVARTGGHAQIAGLAKEAETTTKAQIDFEATPPGAPGIGNAESSGGPTSIQKSLRVNGIVRTATEFVGAVNVVAFAVEDLALVVGPPSHRRRYLDILISQGDPGYLRAIQRYQRVVTQRNHLMRLIRDRRAGLDELPFWDERLAEEGGAIMELRARTVSRLESLADAAHETLSSAVGALRVGYQPRVTLEGDPAAQDSRKLQEALLGSLESVREREIAQGVTMMGPHRDELQIQLDGHHAGAFASRGQARTIAFALKLAEAAFVRDATSRKPVLALDDVLSELDLGRRRLAFDAARDYEQVIMTTTDLEQVDPPVLADAHAWKICRGEVERVDL